MGVNRNRLLADAGLVLALAGAGLAVAFGWASELSSHELMEGFMVSNTVLGLSLAGYPIARARPAKGVDGYVLPHDAIRITTTTDRCASGIAEQGVWVNVFS